MYIIYKLTNKINNKIYFGYTKQSLNKRFYGHYKEPRNTIISRSIRKYGTNVFTKETILECEQENDAKFIERFLIYRYQTNVIKFPHGNGMNMTDGGEGAQGYKHSIDQRTKWSRERKGKPTFRSTVNELSDPLNKKVYQFNQVGELIAEYPSAKIAGQSVGVDPSNISKCCNGIARTCGGFIFQYNQTYIERNVIPRYNQMFGKANPRSRQCFLYDNKTNSTTTFQSLGELSRITGIHYSSVKKSAGTGKHICSGRFLVSYYPQRE